MNQGTLNKKIIGIGILLVLVAAIGGFVIVRNMTNPSQDEASNSPRNLFPFGNNSSRPTEDPISTINESGEPPVSELSGIEISTTTGSRLRQITQYPVTQFFSGSVTKKILEPKLNETTGVTSLVARETPLNILRWNIKQTGILMDAEINPDSIIIKQASQSFIQNAEELWFTNNGTRAIYRSATAPQYTIKSVTGTLPAETTSLDYCTVSLTEPAGLGTKSNQVAALQKYINKRLGTSLATDGSFGPKTLTIMKPLQERLEIDSTGVYDEATRQAINADCAERITAFNDSLRIPRALTATPLPDAIITGDVSPDGNLVFTLTKTPQGVIGTIMKPDGTSRKNIFSSPLTEWSAQWFTAKTIALTTRASSKADGYTYFLDTTTGSLKKILGPLRGLTTHVSPQGTTILYSTSSEQGISTFLYTTATGVTRRFDLATLPKKCTWSTETLLYCGVPQSVAGNNYPDDWYQGTRSFNDGIWEIDTTRNRTTNLVPADNLFDVTSIKKSPDASYLYFINRTDNTLWSYRLRS